MYYHILIETNEKVGKSKQNKIITEIDIENKDEIINDILMPYLVGTEIVFNGYFLNKKDIMRLKIVTTEQSGKKILEDKSRRMSASRILYCASSTDIFTSDDYITDVTKTLLLEAREKVDNPISITEHQEEKQDKTKVFIVHGRDSEAKLEVARFIERMGFEPIILHEQASEGMTIIEKIEKYSDVGFGIILYTPCDVGYERDDENSKMFRARQNVVFEHGYLIAKLGRGNVCALVKQDVERPNDISGIVYIPFDSNDGWKIPLAKEMKNSGFEVDFNLFL